jgi:hypothetical protein
MFDIKKKIKKYLCIISTPNKITSVCKTINLTEPTSPIENAEYLALNNSNEKIMLYMKVGFFKQLNLRCKFV